jgi:hypothetical protein
LSITPATALGSRWLLLLVAVPLSCKRAFPFSTEPCQPQSNAGSVAMSRHKANPPSHLAPTCRYDWCMRVLCALFMTILPVAAQQFTTAQLAHQPLTNDNIVTLAKAGFDELFILQLIHSSRTNFDTSVQALVSLKQAGVSDDLIRMMAIPGTSMPAAPAATTPPEPKKPPKKHVFGLFKRSSN